ncbi:uncharacterized protein V1518DRAFT_218340 [Limtongia smithiae]|uniref:uncharacterized protein n=1 Tax=Limtongia smithiae TaxID=1125753 RepID=UPI0034CD7CAB
MATAAERAALDGSYTIHATPVGSGRDMAGFGAVAGTTPTTVRSTGATGIRTTAGNRNGGVWGFFTGQRQRKISRGSEGAATAAATMSTIGSAGRRVDGGSFAAGEPRAAGNRRHSGSGNTANLRTNTSMSTSSQRVLYDDQGNTYIVHERDIVFDNPTGSASTSRRRAQSSSQPQQEQKYSQPQHPRQPSTPALRRVPPPPPPPHHPAPPPPPRQQLLPMQMPMQMQHPWSAGMALTPPGTQYIPVVMPNGDVVWTLAYSTR